MWQQTGEANQLWRYTAEVSVSVSFDGLKGCTTTWSTETLRLLRRTSPAPQLPGSPAPRLPGSPAPRLTPPTSTNRLFVSQGSFQSKLNGLVIDVSGGSRDAGTKLICWPYNGKSNQKW